MARPRIYPTRAAQQSAYRRRKKIAAYLKSKERDWETPPDLFQALDKEFAFTIDVAASAENALCPDYYTIADDALTKPWRGVCWCNPPYGKTITPRWIQKAWESSQEGATVVVLVPARTCTIWWHEFVEPFAEVRLLRGRQKFRRKGVIVGTATFPSAVVIFRPPGGDEET